MSDQLATEIRHLVDAGAPPITLEELLLVPLTEPPRRRHSRLALAVLAGGFAVIILAAVVATTRSDESVTAAPASTACRSGRPDLEVFMKVDAPPDEIAAVRSYLATQRSVCAVRFVDKAAAYQEFLRIFRKNPDITRDITAEDLPTAFRVYVRGQASSALVESLNSRLGVDQVTTPARTHGR